MIKTITGNIFNGLDSSRNTFVIQCCNALGVMGSGIAKQYADLYPKGMEAYQQHLKQFVTPEDALGTYVKFGKMFNIIGQVKPDTSKRAVNYGAMAKALCEIRRELSQRIFNIPTITDPKFTVLVPVNMGCDRAGGDWNIMQEVIEQCLRMDPYITIIYVEWDGTYVKRPA